MAKKAVAVKKTTEVEGMERAAEMFDPKLILANKNSRFGLKKARVEAMKDAIIRDGGVLEPVEIEPLDEEELKSAPEGCEFLLNFGHYRLAGVLAANAEGHNFQIPAVLVDKLDPVTRLKRQLSENLERENQTPIDKAIAIQQCLDAGITKMEVRNIFATVGGRKGTKSQPASNSFINMTLSFLDLPKKIQTLIHEGDIGVADAYWLTKQPADQQELAVEKAQAARLKEIAREEDEETKFLEDEKKQAEAEAKAKEAGKALETAQAEVEAGIESLKEIADKNLELFKAKTAETDKEKKKALEAELKEAEKAARAAEVELDKKRKELVKQQEKAAKQATEAEARAKKLADAREAAKAAKSKTSTANPGGKSKADAPLQVKKSAAVDDKNRPNTGGVALTAGAIVKVFSDLALPGPYPKVRKIADAVVALCKGRIKDGELMATLAAITGEKTEAKTK